MLRNSIAYGPLHWRHSLYTISLIILKESPAYIVQDRIAHTAAGIISGN